MSLRRPILSMTVSAAIVTIRLTRPMMTLSRAAAFVARAGRPEDVGRVVEDRVDPRELVEDGDREGQQDDLAVLAHEERDLPLPVLGGEGLLDLADLEVGLVASTAWSPVDHGTASSRRPTWNSQRGVSGTVNSSRKKIAAGTAITTNIQRQAISAGRRLRDDEVRQVGQQDAEHDVELHEADQPAAVAPAGRSRRCRSGATTEATPTPMPPRNRKIWNSARLRHEGACPARRRSTGCRSRRAPSCGRSGRPACPATSAPKMVPISAVATVKPSPPGLSW